LLTGVTVRDVMTRQCVAVPGDLRLDRLVADHVLGAEQRCFFVTDNRDVVGLITLHNIRAVPRDRWDQVTAGQAMTPVDAPFQVHSNEDVLTLLRRMDKADVNQVPVTDNGNLLGMFTRSNLLRYMRLRTELGM
jgi:CBS domain-containing protein